MNDAVPQDPPTRKTGRRAILVGGVGALALGGAAFAVTYLNLVPLGAGSTDPQTAAVGHADVGTPLSNIDFLPLDPIVISLDTTTGVRHLRLSMTLEVPKAHVAEVDFMKPRIMDVVNTYLRALQPDTFDEAAALVRLRAQLLRRLQVTLGDGRVNDLLISEFVLS